MNLTSTVAMLFLLLTGPDPGGSSAPTPRNPGPDPTFAVPLRSPEPPQAQVGVGEPAPDFSFQTQEGSWKNLHDLSGQTAVLLVFGANDGDLKVLEAERDALLDLGILPVAVMDVKPKTAWSAARRLGLRYTVLADPRRVIGVQFNVVDSSAQNTFPGWFVVDRERRVCGLWRGSLPNDGYRRAAARALGLALPDVALPATSR